MKGVRFAAFVFSVLLARAGPAQAQAATRWVLTGETAHYSLQGAGDVLSESGATLSVRSLSGAGKGFGGGITALDAVPYRGKRVRLSGSISTQNVQGGAGLWLRADGVTGSLVFANTQREPVLGNAAGVAREVELTVPAEAHKLLLGPLLSGRGFMSVTQLRIQVIEDSRSPTPAASIMSAAFTLIRKQALFADRIQWEEMEPTFLASMATAKAEEDAYVAIERLLRALDDRHSHLLRPAAAKRFSQDGIPTSQASVLVQDAVGHIVLPGFSGTSAAAGQVFSIDIARAIAGAAPSVKCGWVVDLRGNPGGNMWPMLSAVSPLLGGGPIGFFRDAKGQDRPWRLTVPAVAAPDLSKAPAAVLTGSKTASSGEAIAVAFRGRPNTRSFGQPTAGLSTGNQHFELPGGARLGLTTSRFVDRTRKAYGGTVVPDEIATGSELTLAKAWLRTASRCDGRE